MPCILLKLPWRISKLWVRTSSSKIFVFLLFFSLLFGRFNLFQDRCHSTVAESIDPWLGDKVNLGTGLSYPHARLHGWRTGTTTLCRSWHYPPSQGSMNSATGYGQHTGTRDETEEGRTGGWSAVHFRILGKTLTMLHDTKKSFFKKSLGNQKYSRMPCIIPTFISYMRRGRASQLLQNTAHICRTILYEEAFKNHGFWLYSL